MSVAGLLDRLKRPSGAVSVPRAMSRLTAFGWNVEWRPYAIEAMLGRGEIPRFIAWGHLSHPASDPLVAICPDLDELEAACQRVWRSVPRSIWVLGSSLQLPTFRAVADAIAKGPLSAAIYLTDRGTLDRAQAVRIARAPFDPSTSQASPPRYVLGPSPLVRTPPPEPAPPPPREHIPEHAKPNARPRRAKRPPMEPGRPLPGLESFVTGADEQASVVISHPDLSVPALDITAVRLACA